MKKQKGFTLIEILIVVVILGILASIILPRLLSQTERAVISEAQQMLGAIRTAQVRTMDLSGNTNYMTITKCGAGTECTTVAKAAEWKAIGMGTPASTGGFTFECSNAGQSCTAVRVSTAGTVNGNTISLASDGNWTCGGVGSVPYTKITTPPNGGCQ